MKLPSFFPKFQKRVAAFTLIELLVVISIIAVLATLSIAAASGVMTTAKKVSAKNDLSQIVTAVKSYYTDYGRYPVSTSNTPTVDTAYGPAPASAGFAGVINALRVANQGTDTEVLKINPRQIRYLEVADAKNQSTPKSGIVNGTVPVANSPAGTWVDPWGKSYTLFVDADYSGDITTNTVFTPTPGTPLASGSVSITVGAASTGLYDSKKSATTSSQRAFDNSSDLLSWQ